MRWRLRWALSVAAATATVLLAATRSIAAHEIPTSVRVVVANPTPGAWTVVIEGFTIHDNERGPRLGRDKFSLRVTADGKPIVNH